MIHSSSVRWLLSLCLLVLSALPLAADSWGPFQPMRAVDTQGQYYVIVRGTGWSKADYLFVQRAEGAPPIGALRKLPARTDPEQEPALEAGDLILARGKLAHAPMEVLVSERGLGFVAIERYGSIGYGKSLQIFGPTGELIQALTLGEIFSQEEIEAFTHSVSSIWWRRGSWIDEGTGEVVLVSSQSLRAVNLRTAEVRDGTDADILRFLREGQGEKLSLALELAGQRGLKDLERLLTPSVHDPEVRLEVRLCAATLLFSSARPAPGAELFLKAIEKPRQEGVSVEARKFALEHLPMILGVEAIPHLKQALRGEADEGWGAATAGFVNLGEVALPALKELLVDPSGTPDQSGAAAHALGRIGSELALPELLVAIEDPRAFVANAAANAAIAIGGEEVAGRLIPILTRGSSQDARLASYFQGVRHPGATAALRLALSRVERESYEERTIQAAIEFQSAMD